MKRKGILLYFFNLKYLDAIEKSGVVAIAKIMLYNS